MIAEVDALYEQYEFAKIADTLYHFAWDEVCDWYIELAKLSLAGPTAATTPGGCSARCSTSLLRLLHPMVPFVTEELWTALTGGESVVIADLAGRPTPARATPRPKRTIDCVQAVVGEVRRFRSDQGVKPVAAGAGPARRGARAAEPAVRALLRLDEPADGVQRRRRR